MIDAANYSATETLRDGRTVEIRAQRSHDREGMQAAIARSSSASLYRRFFAVRREFSEKEADYFLDIDFVNHVALVAVADDAGQPTIVGGGRYVVVRARSSRSRVRDRRRISGPRHRLSIDAPSRNPRP